MPMYIDVQLNEININNSLQVPGYLWYVYVLRKLVGYYYYYNNIIGLNVYIMITSEEEDGKQ